MSWFDDEASPCDPVIGINGERVVIDMPGMGKLLLSPENAREIARRLIAMADMLEPPAPPPAEGKAQ